MKKLKVLILLTLSCLTTTLSAQPRYKEYYKDQLEKGEKILYADYQSISIQTATRDYVNKTFYPEKKILTHYITYKNSQFKVKDGIYREWYDNGKLWKEGAFKNNEKDGVWSYYNFNTGLKEEYGACVKGERTGLWINLDSLGRTTIEKNYIEGNLHGAYNIYNESGELAIRQQYEEGKMVKEEKLLDNLITDPANLGACQVKPYCKGCENENTEQQQACTDQMTLEAIYKNIRYPALAREEGVMGTVVIRFIIEKDGSLTNITVLRGICEVIEQECLRVMHFLPKWMPGRVNEVPVRVEFNLPIRFKLE